MKGELEWGSDGVYKEYQTDAIASSSIDTSSWIEINGL